MTESGESQILRSFENDLLEIERECGRSDELNVFMLEYRALLEQLRKSEDSGRRIDANNRQLQAEILANDAKLPYAKRIMTDSEQNIITLKQNVEDSLTEVLKAQSVEGEKKREIGALRGDIEALGRQLDSNIATTHHTQPQLEKLLLEKSDLAVSLNGELEQVAKLRDAVQSAVEEHEKTQLQRQELHENTEKLTEELQVKEEDIGAMEWRREQLKTQLDTVEQMREETEVDMEEKRKLLKEHQVNIERVRRINEQHKIEREKVAYEIDVLSAKYLNLQDSCKVQYKRLDDLTNDTKLKTEQVKSTEGEAEQLKRQMEKVEKIGGVLRGKIEAKEEQKVNMEIEKREVRQQTLELEHDQSDHNKRIRMVKKEVKKAQVDDRKIKKDKQNESQKTKDRTLKLDKSELNQKLLEEQIEQLKSKYASQFEENAKTDKERLDYMTKAMNFQNNYLALLEKDKALQDSLVSVNKSLLSDENQEKCLKNMCEAVRNDINLANRTMLELRTEMTENKQDMQTKLTEVDQLKTEVDRLGGQVRQEETQAEWVERFNEKLRELIEDEQELNRSIKQNCANQNEDYHRMIRTMGEIQFEKGKHDTELHKVVTERNLLDKQIISRDMELKGLYEKLKLQSSVMSKGERSYIEKEWEAEALKRQVKELVQERTLLRRKGEGAKSLRDQIEAVRRELTHNRHACRVLEDEVEIPVNVHRWRALQGSDPSTYALVEKLQGLNSRYLRVCGEIGEREKVLRLQEKVYVDMKAAICRQPGPEVSEQLAVYQQVLKEKAKQLKAMRDECKMLENQEAEYKVEIQSLVRELQHVNKKFFVQVAIDQKHARMGQKEREQSGGARPRTTTPRDLRSPQEGDQQQQNKPKTGQSSTSAKGVKFAEQMEEEKDEENDQRGETAENEESPESQTGPADPLESENPEENSTAEVDGTTQEESNVEGSNIPDEGKETGSPKPDENQPDGGIMEVDGGTEERQTEEPPGDSQGDEAENTAPETSVPAE